ERLEIFADRNDAGAGGVERHSFDPVAFDARVFESLAGGFDEGVHLILMGLRGVVGVFALAVERVFGDGGGETAFVAVEKSNANAEGSEIYACNDGHSVS